MTKSIISGLGLLAVVTAILLWLAGVYELSGPGALALGLVGFVFAIFFARFGGFKPFFPATDLGEADGELDRGTATVSAPEDRRLVGVGAEAEGSESLFGNRNPETLPPPSEPIFGDTDDIEDSLDDDVDHRPLFGEALSEQLARDRPADEQAPMDEHVPSPTAPAMERSNGFVQGLQEAEQAAVAGSNDSPDRTSIVADVNPPWTDTAGTEDTDAADTAVEEDADGDADGASNDVGLEDLDNEELAASLDPLDPADPSDPPDMVDYVAEPMTSPSTGLAVSAGTELPVIVETPAPLELHKYSSTEIMSVVKSQEGVLVDTLIEEGVLSTSGPITDKDIRTMVFVAVSSNELIEVLTQAHRESVALNGGGDHALGSGD